NRETSSHQQVLAFLDTLEQRTSDLRSWTLTLSPEGRRVPVVLAARPMVDNPGAAHRSGKPIVYLQANIHAGEVEGKEAAQMLLRDLAVGPLKSLLDSVILLVVPIYNADGNDHFAPGEVNRPGQNGPAIVGERANGQGFDLNRDYVKQEAPETRASLALIERWDPDVFIDLHTTNGSYHGYLLTYSPGLNPNSPPANDYVRDHLLPTIRERMRQRHHQETFWYGNFRNQTPDSLIQGWETYDPRPRFGTNLMGLRGRVSILSEAYSNAPLGDRISVSYNFVRETLSLLAEQAGRVKALALASDRFAPDSVVVRSVMAPPTMQDVIAEITEPADDGAGPFAHRRRTGVYRTIRMPVFDRFTALRREAMPAGYLISAPYSDLVNLLLAQGIVVERLGTPWAGSVEAFAVDTMSAARFVFEGHRAVTVEGHWASRADSMRAGSFYVPASQQLGALAAYLLEPSSEDGFLAWGFLDRSLRTHGVYPIRRVRQPLVADLEVMSNPQSTISNEP
ncbi:MAG: M14 family metallopeptidase, partial [Gemmatimonadota bacterium]